MSWHTAAEWTDSRGERKRLVIDDKGNVDGWTEEIDVEGRPYWRQNMNRHVDNLVAWLRGIAAHLVSQQVPDEAGGEE